jgi:hypothetical protein
MQKKPFNNILILGWATFRAIFSIKSSGHFVRRKFKEDNDAG